MAPIKEIIRNSFNPQATDEDKEQCKKALEMYANLGDPPSRIQFLKEFDAMGGTKGDLTWLAGFEKKIEGNKQWSTGVNEDYLTRTTHIKKIDPIKNMAPIKEMYPIKDMAPTKEMAPIKEIRL